MQTHSVSSVTPVLSLPVENKAEVKKEQLSALQQKTKLRNIPL